MKRPNAFTLVELLIASVIFVVVMTTIYSAFHTGIFGFRNIEEIINTYQTARQILERINLDLRNSFFYSEEESKFTGENNKLSFFTLVDSYQGDKIIPEYAFVAYKLEGNKLMRLCRKRQDALNDKLDIESDEMASNVGEIIFSYGYFGAGSQEIRWKDSWEDKKAFPLAVKINLTIKDKGEQNFQRTIYLPR